MERKKTKTQEKPKDKDVGIEGRNSGIIINNAKNFKTENQLHGAGVSKESDKNWWFCEIWYEHREVFKTLAEHAAFSMILIFFLLIIDFIIENSHLQEEKKYIIRLLDFFGIISSLFVFTVSFIIKLIILAIKSVKKWMPITSDHRMIIM